MGADSRFFGCNLRIAAEEPDPALFSNQVQQCRSNFELRHLRICMESFIFFEFSQEYCKVCSYLCYRIVKVSVEVLSIESNRNYPLRFSFGSVISQCYFSQQYTSFQDIF